MCLYLLSTTVSTDSGYTLETAINFQSSLDTATPPDIQRPPVSDSHTLSANVSSCESRHLELLLSTADEVRAPFCWQSCPGVVWWSEWYPKCFPSSVPKHPTVSPCCTQFLMEVIFLVFVFTCNPLPLIFLS